MTTTDKIAQSTAILVWSRLAMLATPVILTAFGGMFWLWIDGVAADASTAADTAATLQTRVTVLEGNQTTGRADRMRYQDQVLVTLTEINKTLTEQGKQLASLTATIEAMRAKP
jgi:uncharacterized coiled-coil protein SlyX